MNAFSLVAQALGVNLAALERKTHGEAIEVVRHQALEVIVPELRSIGAALEGNEDDAACAVRNVAARIETILQLAHVPRAELFEDRFPRKEMQ